MDSDDLLVKVAVGMTTQDVVFKATVTERGTSREISSARIRVEHTTLDDLRAMRGGDLLGRIQQDAKDMALSLAKRNLRQA